MIILIGGSTHTGKTALAQKLIEKYHYPSMSLDEKCGFQLFEKRTPINHVQPNMKSDSYFYYCKYKSYNK